MSITREGPLSEIFSPYVVDRRFRNWLWLFIKINSIEFHNVEYGSNYRKKMADFLLKNDLIKNQAMQCIEKGFASKEELEWISEGKRQTTWLITYLCNMLSLDKNKLPPSLTNREIVITIVDYYSFKPNQLSFFINSLQLSWRAQEKKDRIYDWFKAKNEERERCDFAWEWLKKYATDQETDNSGERNHDDLILLFEKIPKSEDWRELAIEKIKKAWSQQRYRQNMKGKRQCNFILSDKSNNLLDILSEKYDLSRTEIIEVLIKAEAEKETYISDKLRKRNLLLE